MLARLYSKSFKLGFSGTWTKNFQMHKLGWEKAEEPEIKLPTFVGSWRRQRSSWKTSTSASLTMLKPLTVWITTNWRILEDMGIPVTCFLRNLFAGQETTVKTVHVATDWFKIGKGVGHIVYCYHVYLTSIQNTGLDESQAGIKMAGGNINNLRHAHDTTLMAKSEEELKNLLMKVKEESEKAGLKLNIQKAIIQSHDFMANRRGKV